MVRTRQALERLFTDRCTVLVKEQSVDPVTGETLFEGAALLEGEPCRLSFSALHVADGERAAQALLPCKLFLQRECKVPAGSELVVTRSGGEVLHFKCSSPPAIYSNHQEIALARAERWA